MSILNFIRCYINFSKKILYSEIQNLNFADEYPKVIEPLKMFNEKAKDTFEVISNLTEKFERQIVE